MFGYCLCKVSVLAFCAEKDDYRVIHRIHCLADALSLRKLLNMNSWLALSSIRDLANSSDQVLAQTDRVITFDQLQRSQLSQSIAEPAARSGISGLLCDLYFSHARWM